MTELDEQQPFIRPVVTRRKRRSRLKDYYPVLVGAGSILVLGVVGVGLALGPFSTGRMAVTASLGQAEDCLEQRNFACAEADYRAYLDRYPKDGRTTAILALAFTEDGQHAKALPYYQRAIALGVNDAYDVDAGYAKSLDAIGLTDGAIAMNKAALELAPTLVDVRGVLADELVRKGRVQDAISLLQGFDETLQDEGQPPYFEAKITQIKIAHGIAPPPEAPPAPLPANAAQIALVQGRGELYVPVVVDDALRLNFIVDSGATNVSVPQDVVRALARMGKVSAYLGPGMATLANGETVPSETVVIQSIRVGSFDIRNVTATISDEGSPMLLGQSFLRRFKSWSIENHRKVLVLQP